jgi:hypothetical protein
MAGIRQFLKVTSFIIMFLLNPLFFCYHPFAQAEEVTVYSIHVSSFKSRDKAELEIENLKELDLHAFYQYEPVHGKGHWFRVYIGTFNNIVEAQKKGAELLKGGIITYYQPKQVVKRTLAVKDSVRVKREQERYFVPPKEMEMLPVKKIRNDYIEMIYERPVREPEDVKIVKSDRPPGGEKIIEEVPERISVPRQSPFSFSLNAGGFWSGSASDFQVIEVKGAVTNIYALKTISSQVAFTPAIRLYKDYHLYGTVTYLFGNRINSPLISVGPKKTFALSDITSLYLQAGAVYGNFNWDGPPGNFENGYGWEAGWGVKLLRTKLKVGLDFLYRNIAFDYNGQGIAGVSSNENAIDLSGFSIAGAVKYVF